MTWVRHHHPHFSQTDPTQPFASRTHVLRVPAFVGATRPCAPVSGVIGLW